MRRLFLFFCMCLMFELNAWVELIDLGAYPQSSFMNAKSNYLVKNSSLAFLSYSNTNLYLRYSLNFGISWQETLIEENLDFEYSGLQLDESAHKFLICYNKKEGAFVNKLVSAEFDYQNNTLNIVNLNNNKDHYPFQMFTDFNESSLFQFSSKNKSLADFQIFFHRMIASSPAEFEPNPMNNPAYTAIFWGIDELFGDVYANSNIYIKNGQASATYPVNPNAPGYPLFHGNVYSTGDYYLNPTYDLLSDNPLLVNYIFEGEHNSNADSLYYNYADFICTALSPYGHNSNTYQNQTIILKMEGSSINITKMDCSASHTETFTVYSHYPDALHPVVLGDSSTYIGDSLWTNTITVRDTVYTQMGILPTNSCIYFPSDIYIQGSIQGKTRIICAGNAYITGNIYYEGTPLGEAPDDEDNLNQTDFFSLTSEKNIIIKYKHRQFENGQYVTYANNSQGPNGNIYLYGAYAALGDGSWNDQGCFTYEYQHPHGAVMPFHGISQYTGADTLYTYIDLHRHKFPPMSPDSDTPLWMRWPNSGTPTHGYPGNPDDYVDYTLNTNNPLYGTSDYPWYNPVWPEKDAGAVPLDLNSDITWERGTLHVFGSIAQRRKGFIHRSGNGSIDNPDVGSWDIHNPIYPQYGPPHLTASYGGTGYNKNYHYDKRFNHFDLPMLSPLVNISHQTIGTSDPGLTNSISKINLNQQFYNIADVKNNVLSVVMNDFDHPNKLILTQFDNEHNIIDTLKYEIESYLPIYYSNTEYYYKKYLVCKFMNNQGHRIIALNNNSYESATFDNLNNPKIFKNTNDQYFLFDLVQDDLKVYRLNGVNLTYLRSFNLNIPDLSGILNFNQTDSDTLYAYIASQDHVYLCKINLNSATANDLPDSPQSEFLVSHYPNPFNPDIKIQYQLPKKTLTEIAIYNIKGQKIKTLVNSVQDKGLHSINWNGKNENMKSMPSGIYFYRIKTATHQKLNKILLLK